MFRMWGKIWKDNHLLKDTVVENDAKDTRTHIRSFRLWKKSAMTLIWEIPSGSPPMCRSFSATAKPVSEKTVLSRKFLLIIWRYR